MSLQQDMRARPVRWVGIIFALFLIAIFLKIADFIDFSRDTLQNFGFLKSQSFRLAEYTNRSNFTDNLTRMVWRRMHWGPLAAKRVLDEPDHPLPFTELRGNCRVRAATLYERLAVLAATGRIAKTDDGYRLAGD